MRPVKAVLLVLVILAGSAITGTDSAGSSGPGPEAGTADWVQVSAGGSHTCGIRTSGRLYCWGTDAFSAIGDGPPLVNRTTPTEVAGGFTDWVAVSAGTRHVCGIRVPGRLFCWGQAAFGRLGNGTTSPDQPAPIVVGQAADWTAVSAGYEHTCGLRTSGRLYCWGHNYAGQLGDGGGDDAESMPVEVAGGFTSWTQVSTGTGHTCARRSPGRLYCWGANNLGQVGDGDGGVGVEQHDVVQVGGASNWTTVSAGGDHTCGRRRGGRLYCWGSNLDGELGGGSYPAETRPVEVIGRVTTWGAVSAGAHHTCARRVSGRLYCWGDDGFGQAGTGPPNASNLVPALVDGGLVNWGTPSAGFSHTCARQASNRLYCWGRDTFGSLGDGGGNTNRPAPVEVEA